MRAALLMLLSVSAGRAATLAQNVERLLETSTTARQAFWGIQIIDLRSGKTLYERNAGRFFVPASNTKLFTTAMALSRLGPNFQFRTRVMGAAPDDAGVVRGDLVLIGGGDPNLSGRAIPYQRGSSAGNPLQAIEELADQVAARGIRRITGDIVGDDTWYVWEPYAAGWGIEDPKSDDGPPVSALTVNDNTISLTIRPGTREDDPAVLVLSPPVEYYRLENRVRTVAAGGERRIQMERIPGSLETRLWGTIPLRDRGTEMLLGIEDPARYAAVALRIALENRGILVDSGVRVEHLYPGDPPRTQEPAGMELAARSSAPLLEDLRITDKVSQNLHAELALRAVGRARRGVGSFSAGLEELRSFLLEAGLPPESFHFRDGSGLARLNLVTPEAVVRLLSHMYASAGREAWISLLPVGGRDGTLAGRFDGMPRAARIHAKTGSLSHVSALSGYVERPTRGWIAFSILVNNYNAPASEIRGVMDRICNLLLE
jgi:D-alanyl-D-alanine carboxypeptidase/D-alanyl-D-alanine-endopeptidase (penicillin-binding protein 4)